MLNSLRPLLLATLLPFAVPLYAQTEGVPAGYEQEAEQAKALLKSAVAYYREHGDAALPAFSRQGEFITGDLYVYVVSSEGVMLSSGGPSIRLIGRDISSVLKPEEKALFAKAIQTPEGQVHEDEYRWGSWDTNKAIRKRAYYERVGDRIIAVGYYLPRSSPEQAKALLDKAAQAVQKDAAQTFERINQLDPEFYQDDLYVLAVDLTTQRVTAHGYNKRLIGTDFNGLRASDGQLIGSQMLTTLATQDQTELSYPWRNPVTGKSESKTSYVRKVSNYLVAVGYYSK